LIYILIDIERTGGHLSYFTMPSCSDGEKERPFIGGHQKHPVGHEEVPHGPDPDP